MEYGGIAEEWKESLTVPIYKKGDKTYCNNYRGISILPNAYTVLSNIVPSILTPHAEEIIDVHQRRFRSQLPIIYSAFVKYLRKNGNTMKQCIRYFFDFKKAYDSVRREVLYNILTALGIPMKLVRLIKMCRNEAYSRGKDLSDMFPIRNGLKQGDALSPLLFNFALECVIRRVQVIQNGLKLNGTHQLLVYADAVLLVGGKETGLEVNADKTKYMVCLEIRMQDEVTKGERIQIFGNNLNKSKLHSGRK